MNTRQINSVESAKYKTFLHNFDYIRRNIGNRKERNKTIEELFDQIELDQQLKSRSAKDQQLPDQYQFASPRSVISDHRAIICIKLVQQMYDFNENIFPEKQLRNHTIIVGRISKFLNILKLLRKQSPRTIVLFTEDTMEAQKWQEQRQQMDMDTDNIYVFKGQYLNLIHIDQLSIRECYQILLTTQLFNESFPDAIGLCLARILQDYYNQSNFLIEILDDEKLSFLTCNIKLKSLKSSIPAFLYQSFIQGNVHFTSMITGMLARVIYNPSWLRFFQDLAIPKKYEGRVMNQTLNCLSITKEVSELFKYFGFFQFALLEMKPSVIAISLIKFKVGSMYQDYTVQEFQKYPQFGQLQKKYLELSDLKELSAQDLHKDPLEKQYQFYEYFTQVMGKFIGQKFVFTNPAFYTPIEENDQVLVIGDLMRTDQQKSQKTDPQNDRMSIQVIQQYTNIKQQSNEDSFDEAEYEGVFEQLQKYADYKPRQELKDLLIEEVQKRIQTCKDLDNKFKPYMMHK